MKNIIFKQSLLKLFMLMACCLTLSAFTTRMGLDKYEIYLNSKLIMKQYVNAPLNLKMLQLDKAGNDDHLRIIYTHCTNKGVGTDRIIAIQDEKGNVLKKWTFENTEQAMEIPVKELVQVEKQNKNSRLSLHYAAQELHEGDMLLVAVRFK